MVASQPSRPDEQEQGTEGAEEEVVREAVCQGHVDVHGAGGVEHECYLFGGGIISPQERNGRARAERVRAREKRLARREQRTLARCNHNEVVAPIYIDKFPRVIVF